MTTPVIPRREMRLDLEDAARSWLRDGRPAAMEFLTWKTTRGRRIGTAEQFWKRHGEALLAEDPAACAHALRVLGKPRRRRSRKAA
jgi:hypothetical protein